MRNLYDLDQYRLRSREVLEHFGSTGDDETGVFDVPSCIDKYPLRVIASAGEGWDHVSVSRPSRCPNWPEMEQIKRMFFRDDETAMQLHVPPSDHISFCHTCLHLWRPHDQEIPRPPGWMVGPSVKVKGTCDV